MKLNEFIEQYGNCEVKNVEKLKESVVLTSRFEPTKDDSYYCISAHNKIIKHHWYNSEYDKFYFNLNRVYRTEKECKRYIEIHKEFKEASCEPNWKNSDQYGYIRYEKTVGVDTFTTRYSKIEGVNYYFSNKDVLLKLISKFGETDIKKYVLGVYE